MSSRRRNLLLAVLTLGTAAGVLLFSCRAPEPIGPDWTPRRLHEALTEAGLDWEGMEVGPAPPGEPWQNPGYYLRRRGDRRPWGTLAAHPRTRPSTMQGFVVILAGDLGHLVEGQPGGTLQLGHFTLIGDPEMVREIVAAVR